MFVFCEVKVRKIEKDHGEHGESTYFGVPYNMRAKAERFTKTPADDFFLAGITLVSFVAVEARAEVSSCVCFL